MEEVHLGLRAGVQLHMDEYNLPAIVLSTVQEQYDVLPKQMDTTFEGRALN